jgi:hypothetical protein
MSNFDSENEYDPWAPVNSAPAYSFGPQPAAPQPSIAATQPAFAPQPAAPQQAPQQGFPAQQPAFQAPQPAFAAQPAAPQAAFAGPQTIQAKV